MAVAVEDPRRSLAAKFAVLFPHLDERQRRLLLGAEARALGRGGIAAGGPGGGGPRGDGVAGRRPSWRPAAEPLGRVRRPGGGPQAGWPSWTRGCVPALLALVEPETRGDPMSPLRWTTKSTAQPGRRAGRGRATGVGADTVARAAARRRGSACRATPRPSRAASTRTGTPSSATSTSRSRDHLAAGEPVISVDTKKKELVGDFKNGGPGVAARGRARPGQRSTTSPTRSWARRSRTGSTTWPQRRLGERRHRPRHRRVRRRVDPPLVERRRARPPTPAPGGC